jgi:hypothetical protein
MDKKRAEGQFNWEAIREAVERMRPSLTSNRPLSGALFHKNREPPVFRPGALFDLTFRFLEFQIWLSTLVVGRSSLLQ